MKKSHSLYKAFLIGLIFGSAAIIAYAGLNIYQENKNLEGQPSAGDFMAGNNLPISELEEENASKIARSLNQRRQAVFEGEDVSEGAPTRNIVSMQDMLNAIKQDDQFLSVMPYKDLRVYNVHTDEQMRTIFWVDGHYIPTALNRLDRFWRDWRRNQVIDVDPDLYSLLHDIYAEVDHDGTPIHLISGHRSERTNTMLRNKGRNTAKKSQHVLGTAADITIPGVSVAEMRDIALEMEQGGVGYYPQSHFIHVDTGRVRQWSGK